MRAFCHEPTQMRLLSFCLFLLLALNPFSNAWPRFELVKEWNSDLGGLSEEFLNFRRFSDGNHYFHDISTHAPYPIWRLHGDVLTPVTWISHEQIGEAYATFFPVQDWVIMQLRDGEVVTYWRLDEPSITPLTHIWGPAPTTDTKFLLYTDQGIIFSGVHSDYGRELWLLDKSGYHLISDVNPGPADSHPYFVSLTPHIGSTSDYRLFRLDDGTSGLEPWVYRNGTLSQVADLQEGSEGSWPLRLGIRGDDIYFWGNYHRIFKFDGESASLVIQDSGLATTGDPSSGYFVHQGDLYTWRAACCGWHGYVGRILPDDTVERLSTTWFLPYEPIELHSVIPWMGAIETQGPSNNETYKVSTNQPIPSQIFRPWANIPIVRKFSNDELLFQETDFFTNKGHVFCLKGESGRAMWRGDVSGYGRAVVMDRIDWIYLIYASNSAELLEPDGVVQIWAMKWPEGCQDAWREELIYSSGFE